uniref:Frizzled class receptor 6 n=1 Tax=Xenopus tropicalis TaxID=8364 RepID=A0A803K922_XENTR
MDLIGCYFHEQSICCTKMAARLGKVLLVTLLLPLVQSHSLFTCEPITVPRCTGMNYNMTFFPNLLEHYDQDIAALRMEVSILSLTLYTPT